MTALAIFTSLTVQTRSSGALRPLFLSVPLRSTYVYLLPLSSSSLSFPLSSTVSLAVLLLLRRLSPPPRPPLSVLFRCPWRRDLSKAARGACKREEKKNRGSREPGGGGRRAAEGRGGAEEAEGGGPRDAQSRINAAPLRSSLAIGIAVRTTLHFLRR